MNGAIRVLWGLNRAYILMRGDESWYRESSYHQIKLQAGRYRYGGVALGEVMLRFDPFDVPMPLARQARIYQGGAGNQRRLRPGLCVRAAHRGATTALVDDHIGASMLTQLRAAGVVSGHIIWFNTKNDGNRFSTPIRRAPDGDGVMITYIGKGITVRHVALPRARRVPIAT